MPNLSTDCSRGGRETVTYGTKYPRVCRRNPSARIKNRATPPRQHNTVCDHGALTMVTHGAGRFPRHLLGGSGARPTLLAAPQEFSGVDPRLLSILKGHLPIHHDPPVAFWPLHQA